MTNPNQTGAVLDFAVTLLWSALGAALTVLAVSSGYAAEVGEILANF